MWCVIGISAYALWIAVSSYVAALNNLLYDRDGDMEASAFFSIVIPVIGLTYGLVAVAGEVGKRHRISKPWEKKEGSDKDTLLRGA